MVVSVGASRALSGGPGGSGGAGNAPRSRMVVRMGLARLTNAASGSVPVFTDHRSTPHVGLRTVSVMGAVALWPAASVSVATTFLAPVGTNAPTVAWNENTL